MPGRPPSSARPKTSAAGWPATSFGQPYGQQNPSSELMEEEEYEDESEDEDVFAFLPPTTAEQQQQQQQNSQYQQQQQMYDAQSPFAHNPFAVQTPQYPDPAFDPWGRYQSPASPGRAPIAIASEAPINFSHPGSVAAAAGTSNGAGVAATAPAPANVPYAQAQFYADPAVSMDRGGGFSSTTNAYPSQPPHPVGPPPLSPPSPSTDSVPSTGIGNNRPAAGVSEGEVYRLKRMSSTAGNRKSRDDERGNVDAERTSTDRNRTVMVSLSADESSDTAASEKDARLARSLSLTKDTGLVVDGSDRDVEADLPALHNEQPTHELTQRRHGKRVSRGERGTPGSKQRSRNPNSQPYWSYAQNAREFATLYGPGGGRSTAVSTAPGTSTSAAMTADDSIRYDRGLSTGDGSYINSGKRHEAGSLVDTMSMTHSMMEDDVRSEASIKLEFDFDAIDEEDSPFPEVRASVSNIDDPDMPAMTLRMWIVGLLLCCSSSALNVFFNFRYPAPSIVPLALLLISYPIGKFLAFTLPITTYRIPLPHLPRFLLPVNQPSFAPFRLLVNLLLPLTLPRSLEFSLNPGPWNIKEHVLVFIMANVAVSPPYALNAIVVSEVFYHIHLGYWFSLTLVLATQLTGFGLAGMCRRFLVWPASMVWPQNLVACTLLNTLHAEDEDDGIGLYGGPRNNGKGLSRYHFFMIAMTACLVWYFLPGYLFEALSFFSFVCWAAPTNVPVNQLFGVRSGLGMGVLTFDWNQITWIGSPMMVPWWAQVHVFVGFVLFFWILTPILYYTNTWSLAYFPMSANQPYDRFGNVYNVSRVLSAQDTFNEEAYNAYSPLYLPATYAITYLLAFALSTCVLVHTALYHGKTLVNGFKKIRVESDDIHAKLMRNYPEVPDWWYACVLCIFFSLAIVAVEVWDTSVPVWALLLSILLPIIYVLPSGFIYAMTGQTISLNILAQIVPGTLLPGRPFANMIFKAYSVQTLSVATYFVQDLKLGHYIKVPPRATFMVQMVCTVLASFIQVGVKDFIFTNVKGVCTDSQPSQLTCPHNQVFYTASAVWGLIGPTRQFGTGSIYHPHLYAIIVGAFLPLPWYFWQRRYPKSWVRYVSTPVVLAGVSNIPPATGINYSSWFFVGFLFQYWIRKKNFAWWSKFNYVLSSALDSGSVISLLLIFFALQLPTAIKQPDWWGNNVYLNTADWNKTALLTIPSGGLPWKNLQATTTAAAAAAATLT